MIVIELIECVARVAVIHTRFVRVQCTLYTNHVVVFLLFSIYSNQLTGRENASCHCTKNTEWNEELRVLSYDYSWLNTIYIFSVSVSLHLFLMKTHQGV